MTAHERRITPADESSVLQEWRDLEQEYLNQGYSRRASHEKIADQYQTTRVTVWRHLSGVPSGRRPGTHRDRAEEQDPHHNRRQRFYKRFAYDPARYLAPLFEEPGEAVTLEELSVRLESNHGYLPHLTTLDSLLVQPHPKTGEPVLEQVSTADSPPRYRWRSQS